MTLLNCSSTFAWRIVVGMVATLLLGTGSDKVVRLFVHSLWQDPRYAGDVDEAWIANWENVLCDAQANGLYVLLVLDVWPNWNDEARHDLWARSIYNVNNSVNPNCGTVWVTCGPATDPGEILEEGSDNAGGAAGLGRGCGCRDTTPTSSATRSFRRSTTSARATAPPRPMRSRCS